MFTNENIQPKKLFIKKHIRDLTNGDIVLHPIYRSDGLMLINQYKDLSNDLALKIKHQINKDLPVIVLSPGHSMETFNQNKYYNDKDLITELQSLSIEFGNYMQVPLEENALIDKRANLEGNIEPNYNEDFIGLLTKSPLFSKFEGRLESSHLQNRAQKVKENLIATILDNKVLLYKLNKIKDYKDILLLHSINTTSLVLMIGLTLELPETTLLDLALANLLIDISVTQIPKAQFESHLKSKGPKKDFYNLHLSELKKSSEILPLIRKESIIYGILDHYEYYNGKGHPKGKKGSDISLFGRIIPIAQAYDEMVGGYFYNDGISPLQALQKIWDGRGAKYDPNIIRIFIDRTTILKEGQGITLNDLSQGTIVGFTDFINNPFNPIVKLQDGTIVKLMDIERSKTL